jgi:hypothetical protein
VATQVWHATLSATLLCGTASAKIEAQFIFLFFFCIRRPFQFSQRKATPLHGTVYASEIFQGK